MKSLFTRSITGIIFGVVLVGLIYYSFYTFLILLLLILAGSFFELKKLFEQAGFAYNNKRLIFKSLMVVLFTLNAVFQPTPFPLFFVQTRILILVGLVLFFLIEFLMEEVITKSINELLFLLYWILWFHSALQVFYFNFMQYQYALMLSVVLMIWANDTFAYFTGMAIGKNKLMPDVSPKKTMEGFVGGIIFTIITGYLCYKYILKEVNVLEKYDVLALALIVSIVGTIGDLVESKIKRLAEAKDSGNLLPGHGGVLDRFDAWFLVMPAIDIYWMLKNVIG